MQKRTTKRTMRRRKTMRRIRIRRHHGVDARHHPRDNADRRRGRRIECPE